MAETVAEMAAVKQVNEITTSAGVVSNNIDHLFAFHFHVLGIVKFLLRIGVIFSIVIE